MENDLESFSVWKNPLHFTFFAAVLSRSFRRNGKLYGDFPGKPPPFVTISGTCRQAPGMI
jgi:hypothetical protein